MSGDRRWTGGAANREWQRGSTAAGRPVDVRAITAAVREYLADCARFRGLLNPAYHPTAAGALKLIHHQGDEQAAAIRAVFRRLTSGGRQ